ncbi:MAG: FAD-dependent thymidylate synthase [Solirubrobacteraceae bacterium]
MFALVNLPETVKGAMFARYSRYPGTLRRLFLEEFADSLPEEVPPWHRYEGKRAADLYQRVFVGYGDDSIAQIGGVHLACEWTSNLLTKILQRPRLGAYLEQSTRYIAYDSPMPSGGYRYYRDPTLGPEYAVAMDKLFSCYSELIPRVQTWVGDRYQPGPDDSPAAHRKAVQAKTFDLLRGLLPAASLSHMGIFASGQTYEQLVLHLFASHLQEARAYGEMILSELRTVIPSFLARVDRPDRGGEWGRHLKLRAQSADKVARRMGVTEESARSDSASVRLLATRGTERDVLESLLFEAAATSQDAICEQIERLSDAEVHAHIRTIVSERPNRRHKPSRGFEAVSYRFEIVSDYAAFRDLQRHRMLTAQWQQFTPDLGAHIPDEIGKGGFIEDYQRALDISAKEYYRLRDDGLAGAAAYPLCFAYRIRYVLDMNAREAMHLIELRSGQQGHPTYRAIAQEMFRLISAAHPAIGASMTHVDLTSEPRLERMLAELRAEQNDPPTDMSSAKAPVKDSAAATGQLFDAHALPL